MTIPTGLDNFQQKHAASFHVGMFTSLLDDDFKSITYQHYGSVANDGSVIGLL